jgi:predicted transcriptional regulator
MMTLGWSQDRPVKVQLKPDLQAKVDEWAARTGRQPGELIEEAIAGYFDELV